LLRFASRLLARLRPAALLVSGDLTDAKTASRVGSRQYEEEWASYGRSQAALLRHSRLPPSRLLAVRGNHDTFDVPVRGGEGDGFAAAAAGGCGGERACVRAVGGAASPATDPGPRVALLALDASLSPGWRRPCNFAGAWGAGRAGEASAALRAEAAAAVLAFGHFPLSFVEGRSGGESLLGAELSAARASAYLCGHLHWRFGDRLHHWHAFSSTDAPLLELEAGDWKESRAWRLLAVDDGGGAAPTALSFRDFVFDAAKAGPLVVLITSPPDARHAPARAAGAGADKAAPRAFVRALLFPPKGVSSSALSVHALALCGGRELARAPLRLAGNASAGLSASVWVGPRVMGQLSGSPLPLESFARRCPEGLVVRVEARCPLPGGGEAGLCAGASASDSRPVSFSGPPAPLNATRLARTMLSMDGPAVARGLFWAAYVAYVTLSLALPLALRARGRAAAGGGWSLLAPFRALGARPRLLACQAAYAAALGCGPWAIVTPFSAAEHGHRLGLLYGAGTGLLVRGPGPGRLAPWLRASHAYQRSMDATFVTGPHLVFVICGWVALVGVCLAAADGAAGEAPAGAAGLRRGCAALARAAARRPASALLAAAPTAALLWLSGAWAAQLGESYGPMSLLLSPGVGWVGPLGLGALAAGLSGVPAGKATPASPRKRSD